MNTPDIRFKGFSDAWKQSKLKDVADKVTEKNSALSVQETFTNSAEFGVISQRDFFDRDISNADNIGGYYVIHEEDFVYNPRISTTAPVGPINRNKLGRNGVMSPLYTIFRTHGVDSTYLEWFFKSKNWHPFMYFNGDSGARSDRFSIKDTVFFGMPIPLPSQDEQKRIGDILEHLDVVITLHQHKLDTLKNYKKAMLVKMFPRNGQKVPEIRFKGFTGDWEQRKLKEISSIITKGTTPNDKSGKGEINFVKIESIDSYSGEIKNLFKISSTEHFGNLKRSQLQENDILFSIAGTLGRVTSVPKCILPANTNQALAIIRLKECNVKYISTFLKGKAVEDYIQRNPTIGAQPNLSLEQVGNLDIDIPNQEEQKSIASYFELLDTLITFHQQKLEKLNNLKQAMLNKMFVKGGI